MRPDNEIMRDSTRRRAGRHPRLLNIKVVGIPNKTYNNFVDRKVKDPSKLSIWGQNLRNYFTEYCSSSGIHGFRYLGESGRFMIEKITWFIVIVFLGYFCTTSILKAYDKWVTTPVIVTFATKESTISEIPFPAVTICPEVKSNPEVFNFTEVFFKKYNEDYVTPDQNQYYDSLSLICTGIDGDVLSVERFHNDNLTVSSRAMQDMIDAFPTMAPNLSILWWLGDDTDFEYSMSKTFTSEGLCYSFNMLHFDDILVDPEEYVRKCSLQHTKPKMWTLEEGYPSWDEVDTFPLRTFLTGIDGGLHLELFTNHSHLDYLCKGALQGFKVTLHHPSELPNIDRHFRLPLDQAVLVAVKPRMIKVSDELIDYAAKDRQCYFPKERSLAFFKSYTQQNCLAECLSNYTFSQCGCAAFYMPKFQSTPICGSGSEDCIKANKANYIMKQADSDKNAGANNHHSGCDCLPSCTSLEYDVEISQTDWHWADSYETFERETITNETEFNFPMSHLSKLAVYYRDMQFLSSERHELYGSLDFFSNIGGLLGLFIGFSVTSAIEIIYFLTLRLVCNIKKFGTKFWAGRSNN